MEGGAFGHGFEPWRRNLHEEGNYASSIPKNTIAMTSDQELTLPPRMHLKTQLHTEELYDDSTPKEAISKEPSSNELILSADDYYVIGDLPREKTNSIVINLTNETQGHTGISYDSGQHIHSHSHQGFKQLTDVPNNLPVAAQRRTAPYSFSHAPDLPLRSMRESFLTTIQLAGCVVSNESANQLQPTGEIEHLSGTIPMDDIDMPSTPRHIEGTRRWKQQPKEDDVMFLCSRECIITGQQVKPPSVCGGDRSQELTSSIDSMAKSLSESRSNRMSLTSVVTKGVQRSTGNMLVSEQLQYVIDKSVSDQDVPVPSVELGAKIAGGVCLQGESRAGVIASRLFDPIYQPQSADASPDQNILIQAATRDNSTPNYNLAADKQRTLSTLRSPHPLHSLRSCIATAPMAFPEVREIQKLIVAAMYGEIVLERNQAFEAPLQAIYDKMITDENFRNGVVAFGISKLGYHIAESEANLSVQNSGIGIKAKAATSGSKFNEETCTFHELLAEYKALKEEFTRLKRWGLDSKSNNIKLDEDMKGLQLELAYYKKIATTVRSITASNPSTTASALPTEALALPTEALAPSTTTPEPGIKWKCACGIFNDSFAEMTDWSPEKIPKEWKVCTDDTGVPKSNMFGWSQTDYCKFCGNHKSDFPPERTPRKRNKKKLDDGNSKDAYKNDNAANIDQAKSQCRNGVKPEYQNQNGVKPEFQDGDVTHNGIENVMQAEQNYDVPFAGFPALADQQMNTPLESQYINSIQTGPADLHSAESPDFGYQFMDTPLGNQHMSSIHTDQTNVLFAGAPGFEYQSMDTSLGSQDMASIQTDQINDLFTELAGFEYQFMNTPLGNQHIASIQAGQANAYFADSPSSEDTQMDTPLGSQLITSIQPDQTNDHAFGQYLSGINSITRDEFGELGVPFGNAEDPFGEDTDTFSFADWVNDVPSSYLDMSATEASEAATSLFCTPAGTVDEPETPSTVRSIHHTFEENTDEEVRLLFPRN